MNNPTPQWARHEGQIYLVIGSSETHVQLKHPNATGPGVVNVALNGHPLLVPGIVWVERRHADFFKDEPVRPLHPIPIRGGLQPGSRCRWGTSLAEWSVLNLDGDVANIRQVMGVSQSVIFAAPVAELKLLGQTAIANDVAA